MIDIHSLVQASKLVGPMIGPSQKINGLMNQLVDQYKLRSLDAQTEVGLCVQHFYQNGTTPENWKLTDESGHIWIATVSIAVAYGGQNTLVVRFPDDDPRGVLTLAEMMSILVRVIYAKYRGYILIPRYPTYQDTSEVLVELDGFRELSIA